MNKKYKFDASMFDKVKEALNKTSNQGSGNFGNIMKFPAGHTYTVRLIPNLEDFEKTFFAHYVHQFNSFSTGQFIKTLSLQTFGEEDPITSYFWKCIKSKDEEVKEFAKKFRRGDEWFANVYVEEDPSNPENNGTVKVLKFGTQVKAIIDEFLEGDRSKKFGARIFDLSEDGAVFKIKAEQSGEFVKFEKSYFEDADTGLSDDDLERVYSELHDLEQILPAKSFDELKEILDTHILCGESSDVPDKEERKPLPSKAKEEKQKEKVKTQKEDKPPFKSASKKVEVEEDDDIPMDFDSDEPNIDDLLSGLDD